MIKMDSLVKVAGKAGLTLKRYLPEILTGVGIGGMMFGTVMACKSSTQVNDIKKAYEEDKKRLELADAEAQQNEIDNGKREIYDANTQKMIPYSHEEHLKCLKIVDIEKAKAYVQLYWKPALITAAGVGCIVAGSGISRRRANNMAAAYGALATAYAGYRKRVEERLGAEKERMIALGIKEEEYEEEITNKSGKTKIVKKTRNVLPDPIDNPFCIMFGPGSCGYLDGPNALDYNMNILAKREELINKLLDSRGFVSMNDIKKEFKLDQSPFANSFGFVLDPDGIEGPKSITFGVHEPMNYAAHMGTEDVFVLDIQGVMADGTRIPPYDITSYKLFNGSKSLKTPSNK